MREVVIYDLADPTRRRTIYADSGSIALAANRRDLEMRAVPRPDAGGRDGEARPARPALLSSATGSRSATWRRSSRSPRRTMENRGDRELGICAMQKRLRIAERELSRREGRLRGGPSPREAAAVRHAARDVGAPAGEGQTRAAQPRVRLLPGAVAAHRRAEGGSRRRQDGRRCIPSCRTPYRSVRHRTRRRSGDAGHRAADTTHKAASDSAARAQTATPSAPRGPNGTVILGTSRPPAVGTAWRRADQGSRSDAAAAWHPSAGGRRAGAPCPRQRLAPCPRRPSSTFKDPFLAKTAAESLRAIGQRQQSAAEVIAENASRVVENKLRYETSLRAKNRYEIEIHKKFSLAAACIVFVLLGAPIALRFPRGGVGLVIGVSLVVFALYYVGLIGGESLANKGSSRPSGRCGGRTSCSRSSGSCCCSAWDARTAPGAAATGATGSTRCATAVRARRGRLACSPRRPHDALVRPLDRYVFTECGKIFSSRRSASRCCSS